uniref:Uncharacterized protein n=1 Tax=Opuntia streptacantha TaxID=393608 RepID=A0A7C9E6H5_OPUST
MESLSETSVLPSCFPPIMKLWAGLLSSPARIIPDVPKYDKSGCTMACIAAISSTQNLSSFFFLHKSLKFKHASLKRDPPKASANNRRSSKLSISKPAAKARAYTIACSFLRTTLRVSTTRWRRTLEFSSCAVSSLSLVSTFSLDRPAEFLEFPSPVVVFPPDSAPREPSAF